MNVSRIEKQVRARLVDYQPHILSIKGCHSGCPTLGDESSSAEDCRSVSFEMPEDPMADEGGSQSLASLSSTECEPLTIDIYIR